ncbi:MAG: ThuA domain-containing protein [Planctomycetota bacterium]|nr:ThuA domain-containing protein [Planctomycetota bacterium]
MKDNSHLALFAIAVLSLFPSSGAAEEPVRVLFLTHSAGFVHSVVRRPEPDTLAHAERVLIECSKGRLVVDCTQDCSQINAENLQNYDAVLFYTTGELPIAPEDKTALIDWVRAGGAFCGSHCASDTFYKFADYMEMVGGAFDGHPWHQEVTMKVEDTTHPSTRHLGEQWVMNDEIYQFKWYRRHPNHVLLSLDTDAFDVSRGKRADEDYANAWCKDQGQGRMFFTALGHREDVWTNPLFQEHLISGIVWAVHGPTLSPPAPEGATALFDGTSLDGWQHQNGKAAQWKVSEGAMQVTRGNGNLVSKAALEGDFLLHVEFKVPSTPKTNGWQDRGNSGVYVQGRYEVQVLDSLGLELRSGDCGGIYGKHVSSVNACKPAGEWQSYDIEFRSARLDADGKKIEHVRMSVWHNGLKIHDDVEVDGTTAAAMAGDEPGVGPILLQDHGHAVEYRNIWALQR